MLRNVYSMPMRLFLLSFCLWFACSIGFAGQYAILSSGDESSFREFAGSLKSNTNQERWGPVWEGDLNRFLADPPGRVDLLITVGNQATLAALKQADGPPVLAVLITKNAFDRARQESPPHRHGLSALFIDQPLSRQLAFARQLFPHSHRLTTLSGPQTITSGESLRKVANGFGFRLDMVNFSAEDNLVTTLDAQLGSEPSIFLALPDNVIFSRENIRSFLLTTYRYQTPVIAFSPAFVRAGALAALFTSPAQAGQETANLVSRLPQTLTPYSLPVPQYPALFSTTINQQVARSLKVSIPNENELMVKLTSGVTEKP